MLSLQKRFVPRPRGSVFIGIVLTGSLLVGCQKAASRDDKSKTKGAHYLEREQRIAALVTKDACALFPKELLEFAGFHGVRTYDGDEGIACQYYFPTGMEKYDTMETADRRPRRLHGRQLLMEGPAELLMLACADATQHKAVDELGVQATACQTDLDFLPRALLFVEYKIGRSFVVAEPMVDRQPDIGSFPGKLERRLAKALLRHLRDGEPLPYVIRRLEGDPGSLASRAAYDYGRARSEATMVNEGANVTRIEIHFQERATVAEINKILASVNGTISWMAGNHDVMEIRIAVPGGLPSYAAIVAQLKAERQVITASQVWPESL